MEGNKKNLFSIGDVASMTDISVFTLRMWERRYGAPFSTKISSGHRRYESAEVDRLKLVKDLIDQGHKPSEIVSQKPEDLMVLLKDSSSKVHSEFVATIQELLSATKANDEKKITRIIANEWDILGSIGFVTRFLPKLLETIGLEWSRGYLSIANEHFISGIMGDFIAKWWRKKNMETSKDRIFILATLEGEQHEFGLQMASVLLTSLGYRVIFLGSSLPTEVILTTMMNEKIEAICISLTEAFPPKHAKKELMFLAKHLPKNIKLFVGGKGARQAFGSTSKTSSKNIQVFDTLEQFYDHVKD